MSGSFMGEVSMIRVTKSSGPTTPRRRASDTQITGSYRPTPLPPASRSAVGENLPRSDTRKDIILNDHLPVHHHGTYPARMGQRFLERGRVGDLIRREDDEVSSCANSDSPAVLQLEALCGKHRHLPHRLTNRQHLCLTYVAAENPSERTRPPRMGLARQGDAV